MPRKPSIDLLPAWQIEDARRQTDAMQVQPVLYCPDFSFEVLVHRNDDGPSKPWETTIDLV